MAKGNMVINVALVLIIALIVLLIIMGMTNIIFKNKGTVDVTGQNAIICSKWTVKQCMLSDTTNYESLVNAGICDKCDPWGNSGVPADLDADQIEAQMEKACADAWAKCKIKCGCPGAGS